MSTEEVNMPPRRIAFLIDTIECDTAGTQKQLLSVIGKLNRKKFQPQLICLRDSDWLRANTVPCPLEILHYRGFLKAGFPAVARRLAEMVDRDSVEVVHTFFEDPIFVAWCAAKLAKRKPALVSSRRDIGLGTTNQPWYHSLYGLALPIVNRSFAGIVANSDMVREYVARRERTEPSRISVIYNGVELPDVPTMRVSGRLLVGVGTLWVAIVASLTRVKCHEVLIRAVAELMRSGRAANLKVAVIGDGVERERLLRLVEQLSVREYFQFVGAVSNVGEYLSDSSVGVLCSAREGLSNAILEYMAFGLPVVATAVGGNSELVSNENGVLVPPQDSSALANALAVLAGDEGLRSRMGLASRAKAANLFSWAASMARLEEFYGSIGAGMVVGQERAK